MCILLYVDDLVNTGPDLAEISQVNSQLSDVFEVKDLGDLVSDCNSGSCKGNKEQLHWQYLQRWLRVAIATAILVDVEITIGNNKQECTIAMAIQIDGTNRGNKEQL